jgi:CHAT domain-containing protein/tetratricopeptide (TPR) repeat protein
VNLARDHLSLQEIEWLMESTWPAGPRAQTEEARLHLGGCELCKGLMQMYEEFPRRLEQLKPPGAEHRGPNCPPESVWWHVAAGLMPESRAAELLEHSTRCDACALLLRQATQDFADEITEQEITHIRALASAQEEWQQSLAQRLSATESGRGKPVALWLRGLADWFSWQPRSVFRYAWAYAAAAILLVVAGVWLVQTRREPSREPSVDQLIADAYTEQRPFELRIPGAAYGPVRQERGGERSAFAEPAGLLKAKYVIKERLAARPDDEAMLAASGRVELLEGHYDEAIRTFGRLLDAHPDSPPLLTDLATAYFERAEAADRAVDYGQSIELLGRVLAKKPDDPVALFNRAIALERMYAYNESTRDWEHYLRVDPSGNWGAEAQRRLSELQEKMKARDKPSAMLRSDPGGAAPILKARAAGQLASPAPWPASLDEEYLELAVREWFASLFASANSSGQQTWQRDPAVWDALTATADVLRTHHKDPWLADLLHDLPADSSPPDVTVQFVRALNLLAQAAKASADGDPDSARPFAESAAAAFRVAKSNAGYLRAREEVIYALVRGARVQDCIQISGQQLRETKLDSYAWLKGQAVLWHATCQNYAGNLDLAQHLSEQALELTKSTGYTGQHLRSVLFASGFLRSTERNWQDTRAGLQEFWADLNNPFHAYESYYELAILAEDAQKWHLALPLWREAVAMIERTPDRSYGALARYLLAAAAMRVGDLPEAVAEFGIASQQFSMLPNSHTNRLYRALSKIDLAAVEVQQGRFDSAAVQLEQARPLLTDLTHSWTAFKYYQTLGETYFRRGNLPEAEQALWSALRVSEVNLGSLRTDADRLAWERDAAPSYRMLVELYARKPDSTTRAWEFWEWYRASTLRGSMRSSSARDLNLVSLDAELSSPLLVRVRRTVPALKHETVISFAYLPSGVAAWAFDDRGMNFVWIAASADELAGRVRGFASLCANPSSDLAKLRLEGRNLYNLLIAPFERHLEPNRLLIVEPDSILNDVPWPALVDARGEYLGSDLAIVVSPGLGYWINLRVTATISPEQTALVVGMPAVTSAVASRFSPLPDADREARGITARFRHSRLLSGTDVTSLAIRRELPRSHVFHFAGHAVSSAKQGGLVLASLGGENADEVTLLSAGDLEKTVFQRLQLVVLSACATAETEKGFSEPGTLVRGFLRAGVPHVVASRWPVDSRTTEQTMAEFYPRLFEGLPTAKALQQVANKLRTQPGVSHPYYWAAFGSYGR